MDSIASICWHSIHNFQQWLLASCPFHRIFWNRVVNTVLLSMKRARKEACHPCDLFLDHFFAFIKCWLLTHWLLRAKTTEIEFKFLCDWTWNSIATYKFEIVFGYKYNYNYVQNWSRNPVFFQNKHLKSVVLHENRISKQGNSFHHFCIRKNLLYILFKLYYLVSSQHKYPLSWTEGIQSSKRILRTLKLIRQV